jgi:hypothetical protein
MDISNVNVWKALIPEPEEQPKWNEAEQRWEAKERLLKVKARRDKDIAECPCGGRDATCTHCSECGGDGCLFCMDGTLLMPEDFE